MQLGWFGARICPFDDVIEMPHQSLKVVEIVGYVGNSSDRGFAEYILRSAVVLERIVLDGRVHDCQDKKARRWRQKVWKLKSMAPPSLDFIIL